jgi:predicted Zn-dependent protease with MMP-like domain
MTREEFELLVRKALKELPKEFKDKLENVDVVIEEDERGPLLGLYEGVPLKNRTSHYGFVMPDKITIFKRNIERECRFRGLDIEKEVRHVVHHEIAHHFGITDEQLKKMGLY